MIRPCIAFFSLFAVILFAFPTSALASDRCPVNPTFGGPPRPFSCTCDGRSWAAVEASFDGDTTIQDASSACSSACQSVDAESKWELFCPGQTDPVSQGSFTPEAEEPGESKPLTVPDLSIPIPGLEFEPAREEGDFIVSPYIYQYVRAIYSLMIVIGSITTVLAVMIAGLRWMVARGNSGSIEAARKQMGSSLLSLFILLGVVTITNIVDPSLTRLTSLYIPKVGNIPYDNIFHGDAFSIEPPAGTDFSGVSHWQDCMLRTFGASKEEVESRLVTISCAGKSVRVHEIVEDDFQAACDALSRTTYAVNSAGTYNWRANRNNPRALSFHSWGVAIDINPSTNPNCPVGETCEFDLTKEAVKAFTGNGFSWGGDWSSLKDYMHFSSNKYCGGGR